MMRTQPHQVRREAGEAAMSIRNRARKILSGVRSSNLPTTAKAANWLAGHFPILAGGRQANSAFVQWSTYRCHARDLAGTQMSKLMAGEGQEPNAQHLPSWHRIAAPLRNFKEPVAPVFFSLGQHDPDIHSTLRFNNPKHKSLVHHTPMM